VSCITIYFRIILQYLNQLVRTADVTVTCRPKIQDLWCTIAIVLLWLPVWYSRQSSWLQIQRFGLNFRRYQIFWDVVVLERGPIGYNEELLESKSSGSGLENRDYRRRGSTALLRDIPLFSKVGTNFADKWQSLVGIVRSWTEATKGIHKRMVRFQTLLKNLLLILHGYNIHYQQRVCPSFLCATSRLLLLLTSGQRGQFPRWRLSRWRISVCSVLKCPDLWLQYSVSFVNGLKNKLFLCGASFLDHARNSHCTVNTDLDTSKRSTQKSFHCCDAIFETFPSALQQHGNAWETWTVSSADSVCVLV
jgi:hypothetical protein